MFENRLNNEKAVSTGLDGFQVEGWGGGWMEWPPVVAESKAQTVAKAFHFKPHRFHQAGMGVADDIRAGFVDRHDDSRRLVITKSGTAKKIPHAVTHICELDGFA